MIREIIYLLFYFYGGAPDLEMRVSKDNHFSKNVQGTAVDVERQESTAPN
jgi:hypothetical protein